MLAKHNYYLTALLLLFTLTTISEARSILNKTQVTFSNGSGWKAVTLPDGSAAVEAITPVMFNNGKTEDTIFTDLNGSFYQSVTSSANFLNEIKANLVGIVAPFAYIPATSSGWVICNGQSLDGRSYQALANLIQNTYGGSGTIIEGDYIGSFNVPDLRGLFIQGSNPNDANTIASRNTTSTLAGHTHSTFETSTAALGSISNAVHTHTNNAGLYTPANQYEASGGDANASIVDLQSVGGNINNSNEEHTHRVPTLSITYGSIINPLSNVNSENAPRNAAVIYCIFTGVTQ